MNENNVTENLQESEKCNPTEDLKLIDRTMSVSKYNQGDIAWLMTMCGGLMLILFSSLNIFDSSIDLSTTDMNIYLAPSLYCGLLFVLLIASILFALGYGAELPIIQTLCLKSVDKSKSGAASATCYYGSDLGYLIGPVLAGKIVEISNYATMFRFMILFLLVALFIIFSQLNKLKKLCKN